MKLLILTQKVDNTDDNLGFFHQWIKKFAEQCESVIVICLYEGVHSLPQNVRVLSLGKEIGVSRVKYLWRFYTYILRERKNYDAVFVHMNQIYVVLGGFLWRKLKKRIGWWYAHGMVSPSMRAAEKRADVIFTSTPEGFRIPSTKVVVVGQGIDTSLFEPKNKYALHAPLALVTIARISPPKKLETLIDSLLFLRANSITATLDIIGGIDAGNAPYKNELMQHVDINDLGTSVRFLGGMSYAALPGALSPYDIFVSAGATGSLDKTLLDAAAAGLPVVSSTPAFRTIAEGVVDIGFCEPRAESFAEVITRVAELPVEERGRMGTVLRGLVEREHSLDGLIKKILDMLRT